MFIILFEMFKIISVDETNKIKKIFTKNTSCVKVSQSIQCQYYCQNYIMKYRPIM